MDPNAPAPQQNGQPAITPQLPPGFVIPPGYQLVAQPPQVAAQAPQATAPAPVIQMNAPAPKVNWIQAHPYATGVIMLCVGTALGVLVYWLIDTYSTPAKK